MKEFRISDRAEAELERWILVHEPTCNFFSRPWRGDVAESPLTYSFTPSSIGDLIEVICKCGARVDVGLDEL